MKKTSEGLFVFIAAYLFFLLTLAQNFSGPHDSLHYLNGIITGSELVSQHHLLYHFTAHYWLLILQKIFPHVKDYYLVEAFTALCGSASLTVAYNFFRNRFKLPVWHSVAGILVIAFSYGFWFYSTNIEVYGPPMFFLLLALYIITRQPFNQIDAWKVIILHCLAILYHQINILFFVVVLYKFWVERKRLHFIRVSGLYVITGIVLVGGMYFLMGWIREGQNNFAAWIQWMEGYAKDGSYWQPLSITTPLYVAYGYGHAFLGGHFVFQVSAIKNYIDKSLPAHSLQDEYYIARHISNNTAILLLVLSLILAAFMVWFIIRFVQKYKTINRTYSRIIIPLLLCGAVYSLFFCFWAPEILEFWLLQAVLFWLLMIGTLPVTGFPLRLNNRAGTFIIAILLFVINYFGSIRWMQNIQNDWYYVKVKPLEKVVTKQDFVLLQDGWLLQDFLNYYTPAVNKPVSYIDTAISSLNRDINSCIERKGKIYIYPETGKTSEAASDTRYIDSLINVYHDRTKIYRESNPRILVIE